MLAAASFTSTQVIVVAVAVFASAAVTAVAGFGFGLLSVPLMSLVIDLHSAVIVSSIVAIPVNGAQMLMYRKVRERVIGNRLLIASIVGLPFGYLVYALISDRALRFALGAGVILAVAALARGLDLAHVGPRMDWALGFSSGVLNTSISASGPPLVFDLQARNISANAFRGTLNHIFLFSGTIGLAIFAIGGKVHTREVVTALVALPAMGLGLLGGLPLRRRFSPERFRVLVLVLLVAGAVAAVAKAFN
ncbi:MAG: Sulfite exporter TauE/SafE [Ilumatobacteraceae bacterium]|nr:Sulfite exporter TauE/SafE [Ilumatobacteraceae bacterium]MCU1389555.1 Sulfite exporter TauE/SafE [Ilumatobacteraceae bacterium]